VVEGDCTIGKSMLEPANLGRVDHFQPFPLCTVQV